MSFMAEGNVPHTACKRSKAKQAIVICEQIKGCMLGSSFDCGINDDADWVCRLNSKLAHKSQSLCLLDFCDGQLPIHLFRIETIAINIRPMRMRSFADEWRSRTDLKSSSRPMRIPLCCNKCRFGQNVLGEKRTLTQSAFPSS